MKNNNKPLIIAEIGSVHDGSFGNANKLIETAAGCGADCVKFQTHIAVAESLPNAPNPDYFRDESRIEYFERTSFSLDQWKKLKETADHCKVLFLSSPFSLEAVDMLEKVGIFAYKIPSGEVTNIPLMEKIAGIGKPVIISSGMSNWKELDAAIDVFSDKCDITVMQCSSVYPCLPEQVGLNVIAEIKERYKCKVGFSDHTIGFSAAISAAALGTTVIEKHFTFSKRMYGSDAKNSMEPIEFTLFCTEVKNVWKMLKHPVDKNDTSTYKEMKKIFQKSIVSACNIPKGTILEMKHLAFKKPGDGIPAKNYKEVLGCKTSRSIEVNKKLNMEDIN